jgi:hypothetical protein
VKAGEPDQQLRSPTLATTAPESVVAMEDAAHRNQSRASEMNADFSPLASAARLMSRFATRTGLSAQSQGQRRYLWTDAFAVCNFLELFERTGQQDYRRYAVELIDRVHSTLGRHRDDDPHRGWISGLTRRPDSVIRRRAG